MMQNQRNGRVTRFFDSHADDYESKHYRVQRRSFMTVRQSCVLRVIDALKLAAGAPALDAGCGPGHLLEALASRHLNAHGLDASPAMASMARVRLATTRLDTALRVIVGDVQQMPFRDGSFDLVCSTGVIEYLRDDSTLLDECFRVLRPGGYLVLPVTNLWSPVNSLEPLVEALKRTAWFRRSVNGLLQRLGRGPVLARDFSVRRHRPARLRRSLSSAGFDVEAEAYFFFMPWPRPFDKVLPTTTERLGRKMDALGHSPLRALAEGYLTLSRKAPDHSPTRHRPAGGTSNLDGGALSRREAANERSEQL